MEITTGSDKKDKEKTWKSWKREKHLRMIPWLRKNDQDTVSRSNLRNEPYLIINIVFAGVILLIIAYSGIFSPDKE